LIALFDGQASRLGLYEADDLVRNIGFFERGDRVVEVMQLGRTDDRRGNDGLRLDPCHIPFLLAAPDPPR
jgi:hypothetical protein